MENVGNIYIVEAEDNFKRVHKSIIESDNIDCETLGVYTRIIVLGIKWNLNIKGLSTHLKLSDSKIRKAINTLEKEGYIIRTAVKKDGGKFAGWNYKVLPYPVSEEDRSSAGKRTSQKTDTPQNGQLGLWTTPKTDNTENGEENIYKLKETIDLNNSKNKEDTNVSKKEVSWRDDFNVYLSLVNEAKLRLLDDDTFCEQMERYRPNADYDKTIEKMVEMFWGTEAGWHNKKSKRSKSIDMYSTLKKNFEKNIVYKERGQVGRVRITQTTTEETQNNNLVIGGTEYR